MSFDFSGKKTKAQKAEESLKGMSAEQKAYALAYRRSSSEKRQRIISRSSAGFRWRRGIWYDELL